MSVLATNKRARFDYEILETFQAGLVLSGPEVKAAKLGLANLKSSFVTIKGIGKNLPELYLTNASIAAYQFARQDNYHADQSRKLLLNKKEIERLVGKTAEKGLTLVPIKLYTTSGRIKLEFAIARGKKKYDKREAIKNRDIDRQLKRTLTTR